MQQEPVLFSGTVYENVASGLFGTEKANLPEAEQRVLIEKACKDAYADEFIEQLPKVSAVPTHHIVIPIQHAAGLRHLAGRTRHESLRWTETKNCHRA